MPISYVQSAASSAKNGRSQRTAGTDAAAGAGEVVPSGAADISQYLQAPDSGSMRPAGPGAIGSGGHVGHDRRPPIRRPESVLFPPFRTPRPSWRTSCGAM